MPSRRAGAFTLIELLVVIAIIGILAGLLLPTFAKVQQRAKIATAKGIIGDLETALRAYSDDQTEFPLEDNPDTPTISFFRQLTTCGFHAPYISKAMDTVATSVSSVLVKDRWWVAGKLNHIHYFRGPQRSAYASEAAYAADLSNFKGNGQTFNLWSFGLNQVDDSSDGPGRTAPSTANSGGDDGTSPTKPDKSGIGDDITNWNKYSTCFGYK